MLWLILGVILWVDGHLWRRVFPGLSERLGKMAYPASAITIIVSVVLMVIGYRSASFIPVWSTPEFFTHINNLLVLFAFYVYLMTATKPGTAFVMGNVKNPQLTGFKIWALAHLLVNGDLASIILFGGLLAWAVIEVIVIKRYGEKFDRSKAKITSPLVHLGLVAVVFTIVAAVHVWLGVNPFGGA